jgi:hypothetical protein
MDVVVPRPLERITPYDMPMTLFEQVLDGEWDARTLRNTLFDTARLTPDEREGIRARLKESAGNSRVGNALVDIALNPWVWLTFATSAVGADAIRAGKSVFGRPAMEYGKFIAQKSGVLTHMGALHGAQVLRWGPATDALAGIESVMTLKNHEFAESVSNAVTNWRKTHGIKHLDPARLKGPERERLERAQAILHASLSGADKDVARKVVTSIDDGVPTFKDVVEKAWVKGDIEDMVRVEGLTEVRDAMRGFYKKRGLDLFAVDGAKELTRETVDPEKVTAMWHGLKNSTVNSGTEGAEVVRQMLGDEVWGALKSGDMTQDAFDGVVREVIAQGVNTTNYLPRNTWVRSVQGKQSIRGLGDVTSASPSTVLRGETGPAYDGESMGLFERVFGGRVTQEFQNARVKFAAMEADAVEKGRSVRKLRIDPFEASKKYADDTSRTYAFHVANAAEDEGLEVAQREWWQGHVSDTKFERTGATTSSVFADEVRAGRAKRYSYADALAGVHVNLEDDTVKNILTKALIPSVAGRLHVDHATTRAALEFTRQMTGRMADSWMGKSLEANGGEWGRKVVEAWRDTARLDPDVLGSDATRVLGNAAKYLYVVHLGFNVGSAMVNMTQPLTLAASWLGAGNVLRGYGDGFSAMGKYLGKRWAKYGMKPITSAERSDLIREAIPHAEELGIIGPQLEQLDRLAFAKAAQFPLEDKLDKFTNYAMGFFSNAEVINRVTVASAVSNAYKGAGRGAAVGGGAWRRDVRNMVLETQFGAHPLTTPLVFMGAEGTSPTGRLLANPLTRQFLSFPLRTFTAAAYTSRFVGGRDGGAFGAVRDFGRAMGLSAVLYEAGKNLAGINLERAGYFAGVTELIPGFQGGRLDTREGPLPVPAVLDIPYQAIKGLSEGDRALVLRSGSRLIPGGIALSRALGVAPQMPIQGLFPQTTYADWKAKGPDGKIPVYDMDGRIRSYQHPTALILRGVGADLGAFSDENEAVRYLAAQADEIRQYRSRATAALVEGRMDEHRRIAAEFERRFKVPLVITQPQLKSAIETRSTPRPERILENIPASLRPRYAAMAHAGAGNPFDARVAQEATRAVAPPGSPPTATEPSFAPFAGF